MTEPERIRVRNSGEPIDPKKLIRLRKSFITDRGVGLSRTELADRAGLTRDAIAKYETGQRRPRLETFRNLCNALQVNPDALLEAS